MRDESLAAPVHQFRTTGDPDGSRRSAAAFSAPN